MKLPFLPPEIDLFPKLKLPLSFTTPIKREFWKFSFTSPSLKFKLLTGTPRLSPVPYSQTPSALWLDLINDRFTLSNETPLLYLHHRLSIRGGIIRILWETLEDYSIEEVSYFIDTFNPDDVPEFSKFLLLLNAMKRIKLDSSYAPPLELPVSTLVINMEAMTDPVSFSDKLPSFPYQLYTGINNPLNGSSLTLRNFILNYLAYDFSIKVRPLIRSYIENKRFNDFLNSTPSSGIIK